MSESVKPKFRLKDFPSLLVATFKAWLEKEPFKLSAVVAYYAILSLPALLILILNIVGTAVNIWSSDIGQGQLTTELSSTFGADTAIFIEELMTQKGDAPTSFFATVLGIGTLLYGATGVFYQLQNALDSIWETKPNYSNDLIATLFGRLKSFGFILIFGFLLLISLVFDLIIFSLFRTNRCDVTRWVSGIGIPIRRFFIVSVLLFSLCRNVQIFT